jgi:hypothetical protein
MVRPTHRPCIPDRVADQALHRPDVPPLHLPRHRLDRVPLEGAALPHPVPKERLPRLAPRTTIAEGCMNTPQVSQESFDIGWH